tara:strand:+ start:2570 stop:2857 length:288 start_codon:yes stop_codon:yes gene_type:complete
MFDNLIEDYGQFGIMILVFAIGAAVYFGYLYYQKQENMKKVNTDLQQNNVSEKPPPLPSQPKQSPDFVPAKTFKGEQKGYVFKNGGKGQGYYKEN